MKKICILSNLHLCTNPRVWKEANSLAKAGYNVIVLTNWSSYKLREKDRALIYHPNLKYKAAINTIPGESFFLKRLYLRLHLRLGKELKKRLNIDKQYALGIGISLFKEKALEQNADLYIAHTEYGMSVGKYLLQKNKKVAFDFEDWYSHDYLVPERPVKLLSQLEHYSITNGSYVSCPSKTMAAALQKEYDSKKVIEVIYNGFPLSEKNLIPVALPKPLPSLIWFSQTIGPGRGIETLIDSLSFVSKNVELHLVGKCSLEYENILRSKFPAGLGHQLYIHNPVEHHQLLALLSQHTIGLALEQKFPESRNVTVTNKILQYIQAGIKILATKTSGQLEVCKDFPGLFYMVEENCPKDWAVGIQNLLSRSPVSGDYENEKFSNTYSWDAQEEKLQELVKAYSNN